MLNRNGKREKAISDWRASVILCLSISFTKWGFFFSLHWEMQTSGMRKSCHLIESLVMGWFFYKGRTQEELPLTWLPVCFNRSNIFIPGSFLWGEICLAENRYKKGNGDLVHGSVLMGGESQGQGELRVRVIQIVLMTLGFLVSWKVMCYTFNLYFRGTIA